MTAIDGIALTELTKQLNSYTTTQLDVLATELRWGTFGKDGLQQMQSRYLNDLETDHLENIVTTQTHIPYLYRKVIIHILRNRWKQ